MDTSAADPITPLPPAKPEDRPGLKMLIELAPLMAFLTALAFYGIYAATGVLMAGTLLSVIAARLLLGHVGVMPLVTLGLVWVFGTLTFVFNDASFIKMKPTIINITIAAILGFGLYSGRLFIKMLLGETLHLTDAGWRKLTGRWIGFFLVIAVANEVVWRTMSDVAWGSFKFGIFPLTLIFAAAQFGLIRAFSAKKETEQNV